MISGVPDHVDGRMLPGGLQTDLSGRVLGASGGPLPGLYGAGEVAGFGGGGMHGRHTVMTAVVHQMLKEHPATLPPTP